MRSIQSKEQIYNQKIISEDNSDVIFTSKGNSVRNIVDSQYQNPCSGVFNLMKLMTFASVITSVMRMMQLMKDKLNRTIFQVNW